MKLSRTGWLWLLKTAAIALVSFVASKSGFQLAFGTSQVSALRPLTGVAFAVFLIYGYRALPGVVLGSMFANAGAGDSIGIAFGIAFGNNLASLLTVVVMRRYWDFGESLDRLRDVGGILLFGVLASSCIRATNGTAWLVAAGLVPWSAVPSVWKVYCTGNAMGLLLVAPFILTWYRPLMRLATTWKESAFRWKWRRVAEGAVLLLLLFIVCEVAFSGQAAASLVLSRFEYAVFPVIVWAAVRFGQPAASGSVMLIAAIAAWGTIHGHGPFAIGPFDERFMLLDVFLSITSITTLTLGAVTAERDRAQGEMQMSLQVRDNAERALRESENRFRATFDKAGVGICHVSTDGIFTRVNPELCKMVGLTPEELLGRRFGDITHPDDLEAAGAQANALLRGEIPTYTMEKRYFHKTGAIVWGQATVSLVHAPSGVPDYFIAVIKNINVRKQTSERLRLAEERFRWLVEASPVGVAETRRDGRVVKANDAFYRIVGWDRDTFREAGLDLEKLTPDDWAETSAARANACFESGVPAFYEKAYLRRDGTRAPVMIALTVNPAAADESLTFVVDLSEQKRVEGQLRRSEEKLHRAQRAAHAGVFEWNIETGEMEWSDEGYALYGLSPGTPLTFAEGLFLVMEEDRGQAMAAVEAAIESGLPFSTEFRTQTKTGTVWILATGQSISDSSGKPVRVAGISIDITERKVAENGVRESERQLRQLADAMPHILWTAGPDGQINYYNQKWYDLVGSSAVIVGDKGWTPEVHPDDRQRCIDAWHAARAGSAAYDIEYRFWDARCDSFRWYMGCVRPLHNERGQLVKWVGTCTDIHELKRLSGQLEREVEARTADLWQLVDEKTTLLKEVHHRVKNNLQVVSSLLSMQLESAPEPLTRALHRVQAMALVHEQLYQSKTLSSLDFNGYISLLAANLFQAYCLDPARIALDISTEIITLSVDQAIPCGLILNELLSNSLKHAFPAGRAGRIGISFGRTPGGDAELIVADNGVGMPLALIERETNSLGLQVVRALVGQLDARLEVDGQTGTRTTLTWRTA